MFIFLSPIYLNFSVRISAVKECSIVFYKIEREKGALSLILQQIEVLRLAY